MENENHPAEKLSERRLHVGGYMYIKSFERKGSTYWDCIRVRDKTCRARAVTSLDHQDNILVDKGPAQSAHQHPPNPEEVEAERIKARIKSVAETNPRAKPTSIIRGI